MPRTRSIKAPANDCERKKATQEIYQKIVELHTNDALDCRAIAAKVFVGKSTVARYLAHWRSGDPVDSVRPIGPTPKILNTNRSFLGQAVARLAVPTSKSLARELFTSKGVTVSPRIVRRHLNAMNYKNAVPRPIPLLTHSQQAKRL